MRHPIIDCGRGVEDLEVKVGSFLILIIKGTLEAKALEFPCSLLKRDELFKIYRSIAIIEYMGIL